MQYFYESDLYHVNAEFSELTRRVLQLNPNTTILPTTLDTLSQSCLTDLSSNRSDNHAYLAQRINNDESESGQLLNWYSISKTTTNMKLLRDNFEMIDWNGLSENPNALELLQENIDKIDWEQLAKNPGAIPLIERHLDNIDVSDLCLNINAIHLLDKFQLSIFNVYNLVLNRNAIRLMKKYVNDYRFTPHGWVYIAGHDSEEAVEFIEHHLWEGEHSKCLSTNLTSERYQDVWDALSWNRCAVSFLEKHLETHLDKISPDRLFANRSPLIIPLWEKYISLRYNVMSTECVWSWAAANPRIGIWTGLAAHPNAGHVICTYFKSRILDLDPTYRIYDLIDNSAQWAMDLIDQVLMAHPIEHLGHSWTPCSGLSWFLLSQNPMATSLHRKYTAYLYRTSYLSYSSAVYDIQYVYHYDKMRQVKRNINADLIALFYHPRNLHKLVHLGFDEFVGLVEDEGEDS